jgi:hypothetical protein
MLAWIFPDMERLLRQVIRNQERIMATLQDVRDAVARQTTVEQSVVTLLGQISQQLKDAIAANDPAALQAVVDQIDANTKTLSDAVLANTTPSA